MKLELKADKLHDVLADWFRQHRPKRYREVAGKQARLYVVVKQGILQAVGLEVDE